MGEFPRKCGSDSQSRKCGPERCWKDAARVTKLETNGRWQHETPYKEKLELLRHSTDLRFGGSPMRKANIAGKSSDWESFGKMADSAHGQNDRGQSIARHILQKSTDLLRRIIVPVEGHGGVAVSYVCPHCLRYPL